MFQDFHGIRSCGKASRIAAGVVVSAAIVLSLAASAGATNVSWNLTGGGSWATAANWSPGAVPLSTDNAIFGTKATSAATVTLDANQVADNLIFNGNYIYTLDRGGSTSRTLTLTHGNITVNSIGANLSNTSQPTYVTLVMPNSAAVWNLAGATYVGAVNTGGVAASITKTGSGLMTWAGSGNYAGALTINAGGMRLTGSPTGLGNFLLQPTSGSGNLTLDGTGSLGLAASKTVTFQGSAGGDNAIVAPGIGAASFGRLALGSAATNTVYFQNGSRYNAEVSGATAYTSDVLGVTGALNLGAGGTTNSLYLSLPSGSLQTGFYVLAGATNGVTGTFNQVYYNNALVASPTTAGAIGGTHNLIYSTRGIAVQSAGGLDNAIYWVNPGAASGFATNTNWSVDPAYTSADASKRFIMTSTLAGTMSTPVSGTYTLGELQVLGSSLISMGASSTATINVTNSAGRSGNVKLVGNVTSGGANSSTETWNVSGDWRLGGTSNWESGIATLNLNGTNCWVQKGGTGNDGNNYGTGTDGYVMSANVNGSYAADPGQGTDVRTWRFQDLSVASSGSITGGLWYIRTLRVASGGQLVANGSNSTDFVFGARNNTTAALNDNTNYSTSFGGGKLALPGGITFPNNLQLGSFYSFSAGTGPLALYVWKMAVSPQGINSGDLTVRGNFYVGGNSSAGVNNGFTSVFVPVDNNALATPRNATILGNLDVGAPLNTTGHNGILYVPDTDTTSVVRVGGNLNVGYVGNGVYRVGGAQPSGSLHLGGGTIRLGGNYTVTRGTVANQTGTLCTNNWNAGTSTLICDGCGTVATQILSTDNMPLYNLYVDTTVPNGLVRMSTNADGAGSAARDFLLLKGDLRLKNGSFNDEDRAITFAGTGNNQALFWDNSLCKVVGNSLDNVILAPSVVVTLDTGVQANHIMLVDNILLGSGSKLYLNGATLKSNGLQWISASTSAAGVPYEAGTIFGTSVPEPATLLLLGTGAMGAIGWTRRRRTR